MPLPPQSVIAGSDPCGWCLEKCDPAHAELLLLECDGCGWKQYHAACYIKRTSIRQRKEIEAGEFCTEPIVCPQVTENGICTGQIITYTQLREKKSEYRPAALQKRSGASQDVEQDEWEKWDDASRSRSLTLICRNIPSSIYKEQVEMYFWQYGQVMECTQSEDRNEFLVTLSDEETIQAILGASPHTIDGFNKMEIVRMPVKQRPDASQEFSISSPSKSGHSHRIFVGKLPDQVIVPPFVLWHGLC
jgi:RNA recognition motif-containing protein